MPFDCPVLVVGFNRPEKTRTVLEAVRLAKPTRLYFVVDGPRPDRLGEAEKCARVRQVASAVDWDCQIRTLFRTENAGCARGMSGAISWFFEREESGIILEDDIVPHADFFPYCADLLNRYRDRLEVAMVTGHNPLTTYRMADSYEFSRLASIWGWATWKRAWSQFDFSMKGWPGETAKRGMRSALHGRPIQMRHRARELDEVKLGLIDSWAYRWNLAMWQHGMVAAVPCRNLTVNIGFDADATHTYSASPKMLALKSYPMEAPLRHPSTSQPSTQFETAWLEEVLGSRRDELLRAVLRRTPFGAAYRAFKRVRAR